MHTIRVTEPRELLAFVPYQLGFQPTDSLVVMSLRGERSRVGLIARVDLAHAADAAAGLARHVLDDGATSAVVVVYTESDHGAHDAAQAAAAALTDAGLPVRSWWVTGGDYRPMLPEFPEATPPVGRPISDLQATEVAATMVAQGLRALPTRSDLDLTPASARERRRAASARALECDGGAEDRPAWRAASLRQWLDAASADTFTAADAGRLAAALDDRVVRDAVLCALVPGGRKVAEQVISGQRGSDALGEVVTSVIETPGVMPDADVFAPVVAVLTHVAAHVDSAPARTLLAFLAWWQGDGARAQVHLSAAERHDPDYRLAALLTSVLAAAMPPGWIRAHR
ncbi:DUF4192 domain-containing protein [Cellulomonas cellasea]|uniref:DUF4192 domain-containing protein n=1 Tax=Cellulomonas cellasea TaxID=43670 RepID=A0A7W4UK04_9CELL|nr:DUF4192 domain-containing protein [Cellulomonas cellasea]MBB2925572.1 hypothetical protein [Cellulomonas cellasea]